MLMALSLSHLSPKATNDLEFDMSDDESQFNARGSELLPDFIGTNKTVSIVVKKISKNQDWG